MARGTIPAGKVKLQRSSLLNRTSLPSTTMNGEKDLKRASRNSCRFIDQFYVRNIWHGAPAPRSIAPCPSQKSTTSPPSTGVSWLGKRRHICLGLLGASLCPSSSCRLVSRGLPAG